jgi:hypothetical protein
MHYSPHANEMINADHGAKEYSLKTNKIRRELYSKSFGHAEWVTCLSYLSDGRIVTGAMDSKVCKT